MRVRILVPLVVLALLYGSRQMWLPSLCTFLIQSEQPTSADAVVVLAGDSYGLRIQKGGDLVRAGFAPVALVSGPDAAGLAAAWEACRSALSDSQLDGIVVVS